MGLSAAQQTMLNPNLLVKEARYRAPYSYPPVGLHRDIHSLISALLSSLSAVPTFRSADPGEFTRQVLLGGRLDLSQFNGLHDLIEADTEVQRVMCFGQRSS